MDDDEALDEVDSRAPTSISSMAPSRCTERSTEHAGRKSPTPQGQGEPHHHDRAVGAAAAEGALH
jgi:hypothetical protein